MTIATAVYAASLIPLVTILGMYFFKIIPLWILKLYALGFLITGFGWEIWYTYGWIDGDPVWERRPDALNAAIPYQINWILNSLYDAFVCVSGVFWVWLAGGRTLRLFKGINLLCLLILFIVSLVKIFMLNLASIKDKYKSHMKCPGLHCHLNFWIL